MTSPTYWNRNGSKIEKAAHKFLPLYVKAIEKYPAMLIPPGFSGQVIAQLPRFTGYLPFHPGGRGNMLNGLMPILAVMAGVHTVLRNGGWTIDQIARLNYETFHAFFRRVPAPMRRLMRNFMVSSLFSRFMRGPCRAMQSSGRSDTFDLEYSFSPVPERTTEMTCRACGMVSFMQRADMTEMLLYCNIFDFAQADAIGLGLVQPECLGAGDSRCVYRFTRRASDTRYPAALRRILGTNMEM